MILLYCDFLVVLRDPFEKDGKEGRYWCEKRLIKLKKHIWTYVTIKKQKQGNLTALNILFDKIENFLYKKDGSTIVDNKKSTQLNKCIVWQHLFLKLNSALSNPNFFHQYSTICQYNHELPYPSPEMGPFQTNPWHKNLYKSLFNNFPNFVKENSITQKFRCAQKSFYTRIQYYFILRIA